MHISCWSLSSCLCFDNDPQTHRREEEDHTGEGEATGITQIPCRIHKINENEIINGIVVHKPKALGIVKYDKVVGHTQMFHQG